MKNWFRRKSNGVGTFEAQATELARNALAFHHFLFVEEYGQQKMEELDEYLQSAAEIFIYFSFLTDMHMFSEKIDDRVKRMALLREAFRAELKKSIEILVEADSATTEEFLRQFDRIYEIRFTDYAECASDDMSHTISRFGRHYVSAQETLEPGLHVGLLVSKLVLEFWAEKFRPSALLHHA